MEEDVVRNRHKILKEEDPRPVRRDLRKYKGEEEIQSQG
jgi:hypothetical protein